MISTVFGPEEAAYYSSFGNTAVYFNVCCQKLPTIHSAVAHILNRGGYVMSNPDDALPPRVSLIEVTGELKETPLSEKRGEEAVIKVSHVTHYSQLENLFNLCDAQAALLSQAGRLNLPVIMPVDDKIMCLLRIGGDTEAGNEIRMRMMSGSAVLAGKLWMQEGCRWPIGHVGAQVKVESTEAIKNEDTNAPVTPKVEDKELTLADIKVEEDLDDRIVDSLSHIMQSSFLPAKKDPFPIKHSCSNITEVEDARDYAVQTPVEDDMDILAQAMQGSFRHSDDSKAPNEQSGRRVAKPKRIVKVIDEVFNAPANPNIKVEEKELTLADIKVEEDLDDRIVDNLTHAMQSAFCQAGDIPAPIAPTEITQVEDDMDSLAKAMQGSFRQSEETEAPNEQSGRRAPKPKKNIKVVKVDSEEDEGLVRLMALLRPKEVVVKEEPIDEVLYTLEEANENDEIAQAIAIAEATARNPIWHVKQEVKNEVVEDVKIEVKKEVNEKVKIEKNDDIKDITSSMQRSHLALPTKAQTYNTAPCPYGPPTLQLIPIETKPTGVDRSHATPPAKTNKVRTGAAAKYTQAIPTSTTRHAAKAIQKRSAPNPPKSIGVHDLLDGLNEALTANNDKRIRRARRTAEMYFAPESDIRTKIEPEPIPVEVAYRRVSGDRTSAQMLFDDLEDYDETANGVILLDVDQAVVVPQAKVVVAGEDEEFDLGADFIGFGNVDEEFVMPVPVSKVKVKLEKDVERVMRTGGGSVVRAGKAAPYVKPVASKMKRMLVKKEKKMTSDV